ncbi:MAG TPA: DUF4179 domain-containing protein [Candidatus Faecousia intestinavium]|nr:DUF4179 domain-containing protein [Candidatus Faecousia intestinavium]
MTGRELLMGMTDLDGSILAEAEAFRTEIPVRRFRPALAAAIGAAVLILAGCAYVALTEPEWFGQFFSRWQEQGLSQSQAAFVEENTKVIGQSVTKDGYTLTVESAIADSYNAYIKLRLSSETEDVMNAENYLPGYRLREDGTLEDYFYAPDHPDWRYSAGSGPMEEAPDVILLRVNQYEQQGAKSLEAGVTYRIHFPGLIGYYSDGTDRVLTEEDFDFDIVFDTLHDESLEMITEPVVASFSDIRVNVTSLELRTLSVSVDYNGRTDEKGGICFVDSFVVLKDGTQVRFRPYVLGSEGATCFLTGPIVLEEVDYVQLRDGTKLYPPEK